MKYIVDFDVFETAMLFAATDDVRHFLNGVHFIGGTVEATNGHIGYSAKVETGAAINNTDGCRVFPDVILRPLNKIPTKNKKIGFHIAR